MGKTGPKQPITTVEAGLRISAMAVAINALLAIGISPSRCLAKRIAGGVDGMKSELLLFKFFGQP